MKCYYLLLLTTAIIVIVTVVKTEEINQEFFVSTIKNIIDNLNESSNKIIHHRITKRASNSKNQGGSAEIKWKTCGSKKDPIKLEKFDIKPNPVNFPGPLSINMAINVEESIPAPIKIEFRLSKEVELPLGLGSTWLEIPCPETCGVPDICASSIIPKNGSKCPAPKNNTELWIPCSCPIPKGLYVMPSFTFNMTDSARGILPEFLLKGGVQAQLKLYRRKRRLACIRTTLDLNL